MPTQLQIIRQMQAHHVSEAQIIRYANAHSKSFLEQLGLSRSQNNLVGLGAALAGGYEAAGLLGGGAAAGGTTAEGETAAGAGAGGAVAASGLRAIAKDATTGALVADLIHGRYLKYAAIWTGLLFLGMALILIGLNKSGVKTPVPIVVPA